jgi:hypothetical protein
MCAAHASVSDDLADDEHRRVARDGKADPLRSVDHCRVDPDNLSVRRDEWAT